MSGSTGRTVTSNLKFGVHIIYMCIYLKARIAWKIDCYLVENNIESSSVAIHACKIR